MDWKKEIGRRIREARKAKNWSQATLAQHTNGLTKSRIGNYEQGTRSPGVAEIHELARALGNRSTAYLMCLDDETALAPTEQALIKVYRALDERGRRTLQSVAEAQSPGVDTTDGASDKDAS